MGGEFGETTLFSGLASISALFLALSLAACTNSINLATPPSAGKTKTLWTETAIQELVIEFGKKLQMVSLLAPEDVLRNNLEEKLRRPGLA